MAEKVTNLPGALRAPMIVLAPASQFLTVGGMGADAAMPTAHKHRIGTQWVGLNGTFGTITKANLKHIGDIKEQPGGEPGRVRSKSIIKPGYTLQLTVHHDRGLPGLRRFDIIGAWVDTGESSAAESLRFHVTDLSNDKGDEDTATLEIEVTHQRGFDDDSSLVRAEVDGLGRVIKTTAAGDIKIAAAGTDPAAGLPTASV